MIEELKARLRQEEGERQFPYTDTTGHITIGVGHNLSERGLSKIIIEAILDEDVSVAITDSVSIFPLFWGYSENRQIAILDLMFAMGKPTFIKFEKMIQAIKYGYWEKASAELLDSAWAGQVGDREIALAKMLKEG